MDYYNDLPERICHIRKHYMSIPEQYEYDDLPFYENKSSLPLPTAGKSQTPFPHFWLSIRRMEQNGVSAQPDEGWFTGNFRGLDGFTSMSMLKFSM